MLRLCFECIQWYRHWKTGTVNGHTQYSDYICKTFTSLCLTASNGVFFSCHSFEVFKTLSFNILDKSGWFRGSNLRIQTPSACKRAQYFFKLSLYSIAVVGLSNTHADVKRIKAYIPFSEYFCAKTKVFDHNFPLAWDDLECLFFLWTRLDSQRNVQYFYPVRR